MHLRDYGLERLNDVVQPLNLRRNAAGWYRDVASTLGTSLGLLNIERHGAGLDALGPAYTAALRAQRPSVGEAQASVQSQVLAHCATLESPWHAVLDPTTLASGACFASGDVSERAFYPDTAPGYFSNGHPGPPPRAASTCGWTTPLSLYLGTFPWVYSNRLAGAPGGWISPSLNPAARAMDIANSLLRPERNLRQDAREVAGIAAHFLAETNRFTAELPSSPRAAGDVYFAGGLLRAHRASLAIVSFQGPRGGLSAYAYNYCVLRFAAFFAVRKASVIALATLPSEARKLALTSADEVLRHDAERAALGGSA